jgi:hypothetical protein
LTSTLRAVEPIELERQMLDARPARYDELSTVPIASGVYTAWLEGEDRCFYVGRSANLWLRIRSHFSGARGGDQFCLYVYDSYIHAQRCKSADLVNTNQINAQTGRWIRQNIAFRWVAMHYPDSLPAEAHLRRQWRPTLNTLQSAP